jgi:hypothetical protein
MTLRATGQTLVLCPVARAILRVRPSVSGFAPAAERLAWLVSRTVAVATLPVTSIARIEQSNTSPVSAGAGFAVTQSLQRFDRRRDHLVAEIAAQYCLLMKTLFEAVDLVRSHPFDVVLHCLAKFRALPLRPWVSPASFSSRS